MDGHARILEDRSYQNISSNATVSHDQAMKRGDRFHQRAGKNKSLSTTTRTILRPTNFMSEAENDAFNGVIERIKNACKFMCQQYFKITSTVTTFIFPSSFLFLCCCFWGEVGGIFFRLKG